MSYPIRCLLAAVATCMCAATLQASPIAHWTLSEGSGQSAANSDGSSTMTLQLGSTAGVDANDPTWVTGGLNGAADNTYLANSGWTASDDAALALAGSSYTIETIISPDSMPNGSSFSDRAMGLLYYRDTAGSSTKYLLRVYGDTAGHQSYVAFYNSDNTTLYYNTAASNTTSFTNTGDTFLITPGKKYYIAAIFDSTAGTAQLLVRDLENGDTASASTSWGATSALSASPSIQFYAMAESAARSFDGTMYDLRLSTGVVAEQDRLYNLPEPAALGLLGLGSLLMLGSRLRENH